MVLTQADPTFAQPAVPRTHSLMSSSQVGPSNLGIREGEEALSFGA